MGGVLQNPLVVRAVDRFDNPVDGAAINWTMSDGTIASTSALTNGAGEASGTWTLGSRAGTQTATATAATGVAASFSATVAPGPARAMEKVSGDNQTGRIGVPLSDPLIVRVSDGCNNWVAGATISWGSATGTLNPVSSTTSSTGFTSSVWTLQGEANTPKSAYAHLPLLPAAGVTLWFEAKAQP
jgi:hypothetical protein